MNTEVKALSHSWLEKMGQFDRSLNERRLSGPAYVYLLDGQPIAAAGLGLITGKEYFAWVLMSPVVRESKLLMRKLTREVRRFLPLTRDLIQAEVIEVETRDDPRFCRWLEEMGFKRKPVARYDWVKEETPVG